jgi:hypothetical protein
MDANCEPLTPESAARQMIRQHGEDAWLWAAIQADQYFANNQVRHARIWYEALQVIDRLQPHETTGTVH